jgi:hypothetical protein
MLGLPVVQYYDPCSLACAGEERSSVGETCLGGKFFMRNTERFTTILALGALLALPAMADDLAGIQKALNARFALTTATADRTDVVTAGSVLVLKKSNLMSTDAHKLLIFANSYKNGRITQPKIVSFGKMGGQIDGTRTFVSGERLWLTGIQVKEKEIVFELFSDAIGDTRYRAVLKFPFEKDSTPTVNGVVSEVAEVFEVEQGDGGGPQQQAQQQPQPPQQPQRPLPPVRPVVVEAPPPPIAPPPPPPPAEPQTIKLGQTPDQVAHSFGQPDKVIKLATKQIYVYKDMKVIFVGGKVTDIQ